MNNLIQCAMKTLGGVTFHHPIAFWFGVVAVTAGVIAHIPMYLMGKDNGYKLLACPWMGL
jgi:putative MFS transporter